MTASIAAVFILLLAVKTANAAPDVKLNWGSQVNVSQCDQSGQLVLNLTHRVVNDVDSGTAGNDWAVDEYNRHIQVWQTGVNTYCADVRYLGSFTTNQGRSPGNTDDIAAGIEGTFEGGYLGLITGTLKANPGKTKGNLGVKDYGFGTTVFSWLNTYFDSYTFDYGYWGWIYRAGDNGVWVNAETGNQGDITD